MFAHAGVELLIGDTQFTSFASTNVQILTQQTLLASQVPAACARTRELLREEESLIGDTQQGLDAVVKVLSFLALLVQKYKY